MNQLRAFCRMTTAVFIILTTMSLPALAVDPQPPFFGPPNMHPNTMPGLVDVAGGEQQAYPKWRTYDFHRGIYLQNPWSICESSPWSFMVFPEMRGAGGAYNYFRIRSRTFMVDQFDTDGYPTGGTYDGGASYPDDRGTATLEKSVPDQATYDQVHLRSTNPSKPFNVLLCLTEQNGYIGVANIASLGVIKPCDAANANSLISLPLGKGTNGQPTIVPDINGDGVPDREFLTGPPLSGCGAPPTVSTPVPTLTGWGLIALSSLLLILGLRFARKKAFSSSA